MSTTAPIPSPGKYVIMRKYMVADGTAAATAAGTAKPQRSITLGSAGRSSTMMAIFSGDKFRQLPQQPPQQPSRPQIIPLTLMVKPKTLDVKGPKSRRLLKSQSKKTTTVSTTASTSISYSMYDENFIRYVNELDSYFKASELRHQSSKDAEKKVHSFGSHHRMTFPSAELGCVSGGAGSRGGIVGNGLGLNARSQQLHRVSRIPQISLSSARNESGSGSATAFNDADENSAGSDDASFCTTVDHDWSSLVTSTPDYDSFSFFMTPSQGTTPELSCYQTAAEQSSTSGETDTYVYKLPHEYGSQETLFNAASDYEEGSSFRSILNYENGCADAVPATAAAAEDSGSGDGAGEEMDTVEDGFARMNLLAFRVRENILSNSCAADSPRSRSPTSRNDAAVAVAAAAAAMTVCSGSAAADEAASLANQKLEAKVRRSNFVRTSCIDLDDDFKSDQGSAAVVTLQDDEKKKESYFKCCPV